MKAFFEKYGEGSEPYHAVEIMEEVIWELKEKIAKGDPNVREELDELSNMIDDFEQELKNVELKPHQFQQYQMYPQHQEHHQQNPYKTTGAIGFHHYPIYPIYPIFDRGGQGGGQSGGGSTSNRRGGTRNEYYPTMGRRGRR